MFATMKHVVGLLFVINFLLCNAYTWNDCGTPLTRIIDYKSVTLSPYGGGSAIQYANKLSINVNAKTLKSITDARTRVEVWKDGQLFLDVQTRNLCEILSNTINNYDCPLAANMDISYTYEWDVPSIPNGEYDVKVISTDFEGELIGCVEAHAEVDGLSNDVCSWKSTFSANVRADTANVETGSFATQTLGNWMQIGPWGGSGGAKSSTFKWGSFSTISGTEDVVGTATIDVQNYKWGLNGSLYDVTEDATSFTQKYKGGVIVGYQAPSSPLHFVYGGVFDWTVSVRKSDGVATIKEGRIYLTPKHTHPIGFAYPLVIGNLNPLTVRASGAGVDSLQITASKDYCTCDVDSCGVCGGDDSTCEVSKVIGTKSTGMKEKLGFLDKGSIAIGVLGGVAGVLIIVFFIFRMKYVKDAPPPEDADFMDPQKPDYGSIAINEVLEDMQE